MLNNLFECAGSIFRVLFLKILIEQVQEQRKGELEVIRAKNMKISYKIYGTRIHAKNM